MRKLFTLCLLVLSLSATAQWQQTGSKVRYVNGLGIPTRDTAAGVLADSSQILIRPADSALYIKYKRTWLRVGGGGGSIAGSGTTNYIPKFTSSTAIGNSQIFDNGTNVGIGTTSLFAKLQVNSSGAGFTDAFIIENTNAPAANLGTALTFAGTGTASQSVIRSAWNGAASTDAYMAFLTRGSNSVNERMRITSAGDIQIGGTIPPTNKVDVLASNRTSLTASGAGLNVNYSGVNISEFATIGFSWASSIGTVSSRWGMGLIGTNYSTGQADLFLFTQGAERMRITAGGDVGIGTASPAAKLSVQGTTLINTNTDNGTDRLQVSGSAIATRLKVNTSGQTLEINNYYNGGTGNNIWIGGGGGSSTSASAYNVSLGLNALLSNTSGEFNAAVGAEALQNNTTGFRNMAFGSQALKFNTTGNRNMAIGQSTLENANSSDNCAVGSQTLILLTSGNRNVGIGSNALFYATTGSSNVALGTEAGKFISGGGNNQTSGTSIYLGDDTRASANGNSNEIVIGHNAIGQGSNTAIIGNSSITKTFLRGSVMVNTTTDNGIDKLQVNGSIDAKGFAQAYTTKGATYTAATSDYLIDCTSGTFTVNLPDALLNVGRILVIKNSGTGTITVDGFSTQTIDGATTYSLSAQWATVQIMCDGSNWKIISKF